MLMGPFFVDCCFFALECYGIGPHWIFLIKMYHSGIYSWSFSQTAPSSCHQHFKGIFPGCTLSINFFSAGINVIIEYTVASSARKFVPTGNVALPLVRTFIDNLDVKT